MPIRKLLIANRGEIACRIMRTAKRLGIRTVAVYSTADQGALHVAAADEAVLIGPPEAAHSYLSVDAIIGAAKKSGADAIHPGYGFLSERVALPEACAANGIIWVGPSPEAIRRMGSKIESKRIAEAADVPCVPGYHGAAQDDQSLTAAAERIGFPVLIKASAGGGGRGMRRVEDRAALKEALASARAEAQAGFGVPSLLIEKLILRPRHIEVQLAGDKHGNLVHLFERECSIQRNYQKVVEEAPAPNLSPEIRAALFDAAIKLGNAIGYDSLGTVEFILDADGANTGSGGPWFLEMNTRLQVEHPVTEEITGLDLVEWQIRIAEGEALPLRQEEIAAEGSAIEVRLNAEDPAHGYRPCIGTIGLFDAPESEGLRIDTGVRAGGTVTPYYDSMLAKVIAYGPDRMVAAARLSGALGDLAVLGIGVNQAFLRDIIDHPTFRAGNLTTRFLPETFPDGWRPSVSRDKTDIAVAAALWAEARKPASELGPWGSLGAFRIVAPEGRAAVTLAVEQNGETTKAQLSGAAGAYRLAIDGAATDLAVTSAGAHAKATVGGIRRGYTSWADAERIWLARDGQSWDFRIRPWLETISGGGAEAGGAGGNRVVASMPGLVSAIKVEVGQIVEAGEIVAVLEAMKLLYNLVAPIPGKIGGIFVATGDTVPAGAVMIEIEAE
jgi:acetyl/propionyl-CoA carboxylase alpha subunit